MQISEILFILFIAFMTYIAIGLPIGKTTKRGRICTIIQIYSSILLMVIGARIGYIAFDNALVSAALCMGGLYGGIKFFEFIYKLLGISDDERMFR